ncbi:hypothetical protein L3Q82_016352 [Scortum barcoo]|uniref:Uncharacterized protein n=1 Tax=Scortum barcoo TaxID=214431 RepID=A0ACB8X872_9TELE|nr:hypothetical protein L3Q82_016352 [Scortum barcoo]
MTGPPSLQRTYPLTPSGDTTTTHQTGTSETGTKHWPMTSDPSVDQNVTPDPRAYRPRKRTRVQAAASRLLPISSGASESCSEVLHRMNQDHVSHQIKSDWLICKYGNKLMGNQDSSQRRYDYVSQKLRELSRFLLAAKSLDSGIQTLQDLLAPGHLRWKTGRQHPKPPTSITLLGREWENLGLLNPDTAAPVGGDKLKKQSVLARSEKECKEPGVKQSDPRAEGDSCTEQYKTCDLHDSTRVQNCKLQSQVDQHCLIIYLSGFQSLWLPRKVRRRPWSSAEKEAVWRQLGVHVLVQSVPGKEVCQRCLDLEPVLRGRHWKDIKNQVHNQIQSQKKQQFHAQMDLQENQEQQGPNPKPEKGNSSTRPKWTNRARTQFTTRRNSSTMVQIDQHDQDNIQNKKKQTYHIQMDHQDQDNIENHKKEQYHTQLDHRDHLQIHKKQLCHARLDHQDHIQIHKKQLYQMDEQTQSLQTTLDRDTSLLTGTPYGPDGPHRVPGQSLLERDPTISPYPLPHRTLGPHMDQLLSRTEWMDESLAQHYSISRQLDRNLLQDAPPGGPSANPHSGHVHF